ncbi:MAG: hypothetical protein N3A38_09135 [Planctomycetota bacterium]|nr:hypothetical protein [Planctomycetota bacterium]
MSLVVPISAERVPYERGKAPSWAAPVRYNPRMMKGALDPFGIRAGETLTEAELELGSVQRALSETAAPIIEFWREMERAEREEFEGWLRTPEGQEWLAEINREPGDPFAEFVKAVAAANVRRIEASRWMFREGCKEVLVAKGTGSLFRVAAKGLKAFRTWRQARAAERTADAALVVQESEASRAAKSVSSAAGALPKGVAPAAINKLVAMREGDIAILYRGRMNPDLLVEATRRTGVEYGYFIDKETDVIYIVKGKLPAPGSGMRGKIDFPARLEVLMHTHIDEVSPGACEYDVRKLPNISYVESITGEAGWAGRGYFFKVK